MMKSRHRNALLRASLAGGLIFVLGSAAVQAEPGVTDAQISLGTSIPMTGPSAVRADEVRRGGRLYFDKVNANGGILGRKVNWIVRDDAYDPQTAVANAGKLIREDHVFMLYAIYGTPTTKAMMPLVDREDIPLFAPLTGADFLRTPVNKNIFSVRVQFLDETETMVNFLLKVKKFHTFGIFYQDDAFGVAGKGAVQKMLSSRSIGLQGEAPYKRNSVDVSDGMKMLSAQKFDAIFVSAVAAPALEFIKAAAKLNPKLVFILFSSSDDPRFLNSLKEVKNEIYITENNPWIVCQNVEFCKDYARDAAGAGQEPNGVGFEGYLDAAIATEALKKGGKMLTREGFRTALEQMNGFDLKGIRLHYSPTNHQGLMGSPLGRIENGHLIPVN